MKALTTLLLLASTTLASADAAPKPEPTDPKLAPLIGRWEGKSQLRIRTEKLVLNTTMSCERATIGPALVCSTTAVEPKGPRRLEETWLIGYDRASDTYHLFTVNNWGEAYDHTAKLGTLNKWDFEHVGTRDGKPLRERYSWELSGNQFTMTGKISLDGTPFAEGTSTMKRVP